MSFRVEMAGVIIECDTPSEVIALVDAVNQKATLTPVVKEPVQTNGTPPAKDPAANEVSGYV